MRLWISSALLVATAAAALATDPVPHKAGEFTIVEPNGKQALLSSYKGKVVVLAFIHTTCPHCQAFMQTCAKLHTDMSPKGLQVLAVAFNDNAAMLVNSFVQQYKIPFPVGYSNFDAVQSYLGFSIMDRWVVPQVLVIDRKGMVQAQSEVGGTPNLQDEQYLRTLLDKLLKEGETAKKAPKTRR